MTKPLTSTTVVEVLFILVSLLTLGAAVLTVTVRNLVHAALWLVVSLGGLAGCYLLLAAEFVAWVQVLIYVGAVAVLLLFGLMLTKAPIGRTTELDSGNRWAGLVVALATAGVLVAVIGDAVRTQWFDPRQAVVVGSAKADGNALFKYWVLPFEVLSVLLLAALVGAIVLSRTDVSADADLEVTAKTPAETAAARAAAARAAVGGEAEA